MKYSEIVLNSSKYPRKCPKKGYILAYTREQVILKKYESLDSIGVLLGEQDILELHLFDEEKEYRLLTTRSKRYEEGYIEAVADFEGKNTDKVYCQETMLDMANAVNRKGRAYHQESIQGITDVNKGTLYVLNHVSYDDAGMAVVDNYRMYIKEGEHA